MASGRGRAVIVFRVEVFENVEEFADQSPLFHQLVKTRNALSEPGKNRT